MAYIDKEHGDRPSGRRSWTLPIIVIAVAILALFIIVNSIGVIDPSASDALPANGTEPAAPPAPTDVQR